ncbi:hypothetical protein LAZ67_21000887, partial [Cordylochernes scorpioides]
MRVVCGRARYPVIKGIGSPEGRGARTGRSTSSTYRWAVIVPEYETALTPGDIDEAVILLTTCLQEACDASMKKKSKSPRPSKPWWNKELSKLRNIVVALRRCSQNTFFPTRSFFKGLYRACHNKLKAAIRRAKRLSWISLCQEVSSAAWSSIHRYISKGRRGSLGPPLLKHKDGTPLTSEETCREVLQNYFPTDWTVPRPTVDWLPTFNQEPAFTAAEIFRAIRRCGWRKSPGPDRLGVRCILLGGPALHELLSQIFTKCLRLGHFPTPWKAGRLVLIPKQNSTSSNPLDKYRPITMINTLAKVFERCILARLQWLADQHGWFSPMQFGFVPGRSAEGALDSINNFINDGLKHWRKTVAISLDISHAFDTVQRHTIIQGLRDLNCPEELIQLSASSLRDRKVIYQAWDSTLTAHTVLGVAQGAPLSPFFFNIVARKALSLPKPQNCQIICFADDFTLLFRAFRRLPTKEINKFLKTFSLWGKGHGLTFNLKKTQACLFHWKSKRPSYQNIKFLDQPILINNHIKILGITFDTTRTFVRHSDNIFNKCKWMLPRLISTIREQYGLTYSSGLKIIKMNSFGQTPLHCAVLIPNDKSYLHLIQAGASLNIKDFNCDTPLHLSIEHMHLEISRELIKNGADIHAYNFQKKPILITAVISLKNLGFIKNLLELGVEVNFKDYSGNTALHYASGDWRNPKRGEMMKLLIEFGADINSRSLNRTTPLMNIANIGNIFEAQMLITAGASIDAKDDDFLNMLDHAILGNNIEMTRLMINLGANVNSADVLGLGMTPLHLAAMCLNINILKILVESKANIYLKDNRGLIPLAHTELDNSFLAWSNVVSGLKYLLQATRDFDLNECVGSNVGHSKSIKMMVKYFVLYHPRSSIPSAVSSEEMLSNLWDSCQREVDTILDNKLGQITLHSYLVEPDLNTRAGYIYNENNGIKEHLEWNMTWYKDNLKIYSSMIEEYYKEDIKRGKLLFKWVCTAKKNQYKDVTKLNCANIAEYLTNEALGENIFLLLSAIENNDSKRFEELIESGIDIDCRGVLGMAPLHYAVEFGRTDMLMNLIRKNADIDIQNLFGKTPLHYAVLIPNNRSYLHLIQAGASLNIKDDNGDTPLHLSIKHMHLEISRELIKNGADIHAYNFQIEPILITAVKSLKNLGFIKKLLELGVEVNFKDYFGNTALHYASNDSRNPKRGELMKLLIEFGADVNSRGWSRNTPLMNIAGIGNIFEAQMLITAGASIDAKDDHFFNVLYHAILANNIEMTRLLINLGANVNSENLRGMTPLHLAASDLNINILKILVESKADIYLKDNRGLIPLAHTVLGNSFLAWSNVVSGLKYLLQATRDFDLNECVGSNVGHSKSIKMMVKYFVLYHPRSSIASAVSSEEMLSSWWDSCQREVATILDHKLGQITLHSYLVEPDLNTRAGYIYNENNGIKEHLESNMTWYKDNLKIYSSMIEEYYKEDIKRGKLLFEWVCTAKKNQYKDVTKMNCANIAEYLTNEALAGDLNCKNPTWGSFSTNPNSKILQKVVECLNLDLSYPDEPTHDSPTDILNIAIHKNLSQTVHSKVLHEVTSDHLPVLLILQDYNITRSDTTIKIIDWALFKYQMENTQPPAHTAETPQEIIDSIASIEDKIIQNLQKSTKYKEKDLDRKEHDNTSWDTYIENLDVSDQTVWKAIKRLTAPKKEEIIVKTNNNLTLTAEEAAEALADSYEKQLSPNPPTSSYSNIYLNKRITAHLQTNNKTALEPTNIGEIKAIIDTFPKKKAPGIDGITNEALKLLPNHILESLTSTFNASLKLAYFPYNWKTSIICPIPKQGISKYDPASYRPISLLPVTSKLFERIILRRIKKALSDEHPLRPEQFGFQQKHSTLHQLVVVTEKIRKAMESKQLTGGIFFDISKAFDKVWHEAFLYKMAKKNLPGDIIRMTKSFLCDRNFRVKIKDVLLTPRKIRAGVPQ